ncbi:MAG: alpha/beta fold hydrolase [Kofleriaceae bacterium]
MIWLLLAVLVALAVVVVAVRRRRVVGVPVEGVAAMPGPTQRGPPLPVILVHGLFGFDRMGIPGARLDYFRGIAKHLETLGCHAHAVRLPRAASVPERARELCDAIVALGLDRVDLIAHSMGGLDARYALAHFGLASRVRSLVTVGTPHRGTPVADLAADGALGVARRAIAALGISLTAIDWLTTSALERFNRDVPDVEGVRYACVVGGIREAKTPIPLAVQPIHAYLRRVSGANDGLVPMSSQYWGETLAEIEADHFAQVGWKLTTRHTFDALGLYAFVVARLGDHPAARAAG